jgi:hypothetical protein
MEDKDLTQIRELLKLNKPHTPVVHGQACNRTGSCFICDGGLVLCELCGGAEGSLPTHCPEVTMGEELEDQVYNGALDYRNGAWVKLKG